MMMPSDTNISNPKICTMKGVTHVVTAITYGMDANFEFKKHAKSSYDREKIEGELKVYKKPIYRKVVLQFSNTKTDFRTYIPHYAFLS